MEQTVAAVDQWTEVTIPGQKKPVKISCNLCGKTFATRHNVKRHIKVTHQGVLLAKFVIINLVRCKIYKNMKLRNPV